MLKREMNERNEFPPEYHSQQTVTYFERVPKTNTTNQNTASGVDSLGADVRVLVAGVAHLAETGDKEVVAAMVRRRVLLYVGELHKLWKGGGVAYKKAVVELVIVHVVNLYHTWLVNKQ